MTLNKAAGTASSTASPGDFVFFLLFSPFPAKPSTEVKSIKEPVGLVMIPWLLLLLNENSHQEWKG